MLNLKTQSTCWPHDVMFLYLFLLTCFKWIEFLSLCYNYSHVNKDWTSHKALFFIGLHLYDVHDYIYNFYMTPTWIGISIYIYKDLFLLHIITTISDLEKSTKTGNILATIILFVIHVLCHFEFRRCVRIFQGCFNRGNKYLIDWLFFMSNYNQCELRSDICTVFFS